mgnify:CR=1 FL=1
MKKFLFLLSLTLCFVGCLDSNPSYLENLATAKKFFALHGEENLEEQLNLISKEIQGEPPFYGAKMIGYDEFSAMLKGYHDAFDDIKYTPQVWLPGTDSLGVLNGSVRTYGTWTGIQSNTKKQLNLKGYWYFGFDNNGLINAQGDFFDAGGMLDAVYPKNLVIVGLDVKSGQIDKVMEILNSKGGLPTTRTNDGCISLELTINKESSTIWIIGNWESFDKYNAYLKWRQTEDTVIGKMVPYLKGGEKGLKIIQPNANYKSY